MNFDMKGIHVPTLIVIVIAVLILLSIYHMALGGKRR